MLTVYIVTFNNEFILPFTIKHYRDRFPGCRICVYDNFSNDNTIDIAAKENCEVYLFFTENKLYDLDIIGVKNLCWKDATSRFVAVIDADEFLDVTREILSSTTASVLRTRYIDMIEIGNMGTPDSMEYGIHYPAEGKFLCFDKQRIHEINYDYGCHTAHPVGDIVFSKLQHVIWHYKWLGDEYVIQKHTEAKRRMSQHNLKHKLSIHYLFSKRRIKNQFRKYQKQAIKVK